MTQPRNRLRRALATVACALVLGALATPLSSPAGAGNGPACPTPPAGNARFVSFIYQMILFRCPDAAGLAYWTGRLDSGSISRGRFALSVDMGDENLQNNNVIPLYEGILNRQPTSAELLAGLDLIRRDRSDAMLIAALAASDEYYAGVAGATPAEKDESWLFDAYGNILDREPDEVGFIYWMQYFGANGSSQSERFKVAQMLELSFENANSWVNAVFFAGLNRPPDDAGFVYWFDWLTGPEGDWRTFQLWTSILSSQEAYDNAQVVVLNGSVTTRGAIARESLAGWNS